MLSRDDVFGSSREVPVAYQRNRTTVDLSTVFVVAVLGALLATAGLDAYAFSTLFSTSGGSGHSPRAAVVHLDKSTTREAAVVKKHHTH